MGELIDTLEFLLLFAGMFIGLGVLVYFVGMCFAGTRRFFVGSVTAFVGFNGVAIALGYRYYQSLLEYCEDENAVTGGSGLDCLEPYNWPFVYMLALAWLTIAGALAALVITAYRGRRRAQRRGRGAEHVPREHSA